MDKFSNLKELIYCIIMHLAHELFIAFKDFGIKLYKGFFETAKFIARIICIVIIVVFLILKAFKNIISAFKKSGGMSYYKKYVYSNIINKK